MPQFSPVVVLNLHGMHTHHAYSSYTVFTSESWDACGTPSVRRAEELVSKDRDATLKQRHAG